MNEVVAVHGMRASRTSQQPTHMAPEWVDCCSMDRVNACRHDVNHQFVTIFFLIQSL